MMFCTLEDLCLNLFVQKHKIVRETALVEMHYKDTKVTMTKAGFQTFVATHFDIYFNGVNGARIYAKCILPNNITGKILALLQLYVYQHYSADVITNWPTPQLVELDLQWTAEDRGR